MKIYLASQSASRQQLLRQADIPFTVLAITCDEEAVPVSTDVSAYVCAVARAKLAVVPAIARIVPSVDTQERVVIVTADTMIVTAHSRQLFGKPRDVEHAKQMLSVMQRESIEIITGMCVQAYGYRAGQWHKTFYEEHVSLSQADFCVPTAMFDTYLAREPHAMSACGGAVIEGIGSRYLQSINGSLSGTLGLDIPALCEILNRVAESMQF